MMKAWQPIFMAQIVPGLRRRISGIEAIGKTDFIVLTSDLWYIGGMSSNGVLQNFDWVNARADCSLLPVFRKLELDCGDDVAAMNKRSEANGSQARFLSQSNDAKTQFWVFGNIDSSLLVKFVLFADRIEVATPSQTFAISLTLDNDGKCKLRVNDGEVLDQWQLRKLVLEDLFFTR